MADPRPIDDSKLSRGLTPSPKPRPSEAGPTPADRPHPSADRLKAVSDGLSIRKGALDQSLIPASIPLPDFPASLAAEAVLRLRQSVGFAIKSEAQGASLGPPPVDLPGPPMAAPQEPGQAAPSVLPGAGPSAPSPIRFDPMPPGVATARPQGQGIPFGPSAKGPAVAAAAPVDVPRRSAMIAASMPSAGSLQAQMGGASPANSAGFAAPAEASPTVATASLGSMGPFVEPPRATDPPSAAIVQPGDPAPPPSTRPGPRPNSGDEATVRPAPGADREFSFDAGQSPAPPDEAPMTTVQSPRLDELRGLALASPDPTRAGGASGEPGKGGPASPDRGFDAAASSQSQGGAPIDLSRTNELLQQLIDAVRRQGGPSMPSGGPAAYPGR